MGYAGSESCAVACPAGQTRPGSTPSPPGHGTPGPPPTPIHVSRDDLRVCLRARSSPHGADCLPYYCRGWPCGRLLFPRPSAYVAACVWLLFGQQRRRYPRPATVSRPSQHPAYSPLHRIDSPPVSKLLGGLKRPTGLHGDDVVTEHLEEVVLSWRRMTASLY